MSKFHIPCILIYTLLFIALSSACVIPASGSGVIGSRASIHIERSFSPCVRLQVTNSGVVCKSNFGDIATLQFPEVDLKGVLTGTKFLPRGQAKFSTIETIIGAIDYREITLILRWEPNTPQFLQIYLNEYLPYWGNRVPYRLLWSAHYERCPIADCDDWVTVNEKGEFLPSDVKDLDNDLAADVDFNGVPTAFWNTNIIP